MLSQEEGLAHIMTLSTCTKNYNCVHCAGQEKLADIKRTKSNEVRYASYKLCSCVGDIECISCKAKASLKDDTPVSNSYDTYRKYGTYNRYDNYKAGSYDSYKAPSYNKYKAPSYDSYEPGAYVTSPKYSAPSYNIYDKSMYEPMTNSYDKYEKYDEYASEQSNKLDNVEYDENYFDTPKEIDTFGVKCTISNKSIIMLIATACNEGEIGWNMIGEEELNKISDLCEENVVDMKESHETRGKIEVIKYTMIYETSKETLLIYKKIKKMMTKKSVIFVD